MNILIADDHALVRKGLGLLLKQLFDGADIREAGDAASAIALLENDSFDVALIDLYMDGMDNGKALQKMAQAGKGVPLAILSMSDSVADIKNAFANGARGYILKNSPDDVLKAAVSLVMCGETYMPAHAVSQVSGTKLVTETPATEAAPDKFENLTPREEQVLYLLTKGQTNKAIAETLSLKENSIKKLVSYVLKKLDVSNRTQAVLLAGGSPWMAGYDASWLEDANSNK